MKLLSPSQQGVFLAVGAYSMWGVLALYFEALSALSPGEILAHRVLWSVIFIFLLVLGLKRTKHLLTLFLDKKMLLFLSASTILIAINWIIYIWATNNGHVADTSMGYFINPLMNIVLGVIFLKERFRLLQILAVALTSLAVLIQIALLGYFPWIALSLATAFSFYGLIRKTCGAPAQEGLLVETLLLLLPCLIYLFYISPGVSLPLFSQQPYYTALLIAAGPLTSIPLILFAAATKRLKYSTIGFIQYIAPSIMLVLSVFHFRETISSIKWLAFALIWMALVIFSIDALRQKRQENPK